MTSKSDALVIARQKWGDRAWVERRNGWCRIGERNEARTKIKRGSGQTWDEALYQAGLRESA